MAPAVEQLEGIYTLFNSGSDVHWRRRRVCFLKPLPRSQYRDQCVRLRAQLMVLLPRYHSVFAGCYSQIMRKNCAYALDVNYQEHDVAVATSTTEDRASRHIRCWKVASCDISAPAFVVQEHSEGTSNTIAAATPV